MGCSDFLELAKQVIDGQFSFKAIAPILLALILFFAFTYHKLLFEKQKAFIASFAKTMKLIN
jgi:hypothetical protein